MWSEQGYGSWRGGKSKRRKTGVGKDLERENCGGQVHVDIRPS